MVSGEAGVVTCLGEGAGRLVFGSARMLMLSGNCSFYSRTTSVCCLCPSMRVHCVIPAVYDNGGSREAKAGRPPAEQRPTGNFARSSVAGDVCLPLKSRELLGDLIANPLTGAEFTLNWS